MAFSVLTRSDVMGIGFEDTVPVICYEAFEELSQCSTWKVEKRHNAEESKAIAIPDSYYFQKVYQDGTEGDILAKFVKEKVNPLQLNTVAESLFKLQDEGMVTISQAAYDTAASMFLLDIPEDVVNTSFDVAFKEDLVKEHLAVCINYSNPSASGVIYTDVRLACSNMIQSTMKAAHKSEQDIIPILTGDKDLLYSLLKKKEEERQARQSYYKSLAMYAIHQSQADWYFRQILGLSPVGDVCDMEVKELIKDKYDSLKFAYDNGEHIASVGSEHTAYRVLNAVTEGTKDPVWGRKHASMFASQLGGAGKSARQKLHKVFQSIIPMEISK